MSEAVQTELRRCWNCKAMVDKDPCPLCQKSRAQFSNASAEELNAHLQQMSEGEEWSTK